MKIQQIHFHWWNNKNNWNDVAQSFLKLPQHETTYYILWAIKTLFQRPKNPTQCHMTSHHKDTRYATKTSVMPWRHQVMPRKHQVMPRRHQICHEDINCATKTSIRHKDEVPRFQCHKDYGIWLGNHTYHRTRVKTT